MPRRRRPVPPSLVALAARQEGLVGAEQCRDAGMTRKQVAALVHAKEWERPVPGVFDVGRPQDDVRDEHDHRRRRAAVLGLLTHRGSVATGLCALVLHGVQGAPLDVGPEVALLTGAPRVARTGVRLRRTPVERWEEVDGFRCAPVSDALLQALPALQRPHGIALLDSALHQGLVTRAELDEARRGAARRRGMARTHGWWELADGRSESPAETWARLSCLDRGLPPDALQLQVAGPEGRVFARVDLAWRLPDGTMLLVEVDGRDVHSAPQALYRDRARQNRLDTASTVVRRLTGADAWHGRVAVEVAKVLRPVGWQPCPMSADSILRLP